MKQEPEKTFEEIAEPVLKDEHVQKMKKYVQHGSISTYDHVVRVAKLSDKLNRALRLNGKRKEIIRGAVLHDYFLYDWHRWKGKLHGFYHPEAALENAEKDFDLTDKEKNIIRSHMWPLTLFHMPASREAWTVSIADKICSFQETLLMRTGKLRPEAEQQKMEEEKQRAAEKMAAEKKRREDKKKRDTVRNWESDRNQLKRDKRL